MGFLGLVTFCTNTQQIHEQVDLKSVWLFQFFEGENKAVIVHSVISNVAPLNLIPGMYVSALIETDQQVVSAVPKDAIVKANDKQYIFVLEEMKQDTLKNEESKPNDKIELQKVYVFKKVEVITGVEELGYVEIHLLKDLPPTKKIVTKGAFYIYSKMQNIDTDDLL